MSDMTENEIILDKHTIDFDIKVCDVLKVVGTNVQCTVTATHVADVVKILQVLGDDVQPSDIWFSISRVNSMWTQRMRDAWA